jgi:hypothetical protein
MISANALACGAGLGPGCTWHDRRLGQNPARVSDEMLGLLGYY